MEGWWPVTTQEREYWQEYARLAIRVVEMAGRRGRRPVAGERLRELAKALKL